MQVNQRKRQTKFQVYIYICRLSFSASLGQSGICLNVSFCTCLFLVPKRHRAVSQCPCLGRVHCLQKGILQADKRNPRILKQFVLGKQAALGWISCMESGRYRRGQEMLCLQWLQIQKWITKGRGRSQLLSHSFCLTHKLFLSNKYQFISI